MKKQQKRAAFKNATLAKAMLVGFVVNHPLSLKNLLKNIIKAPV